MNVRVRYFSYLRAVACVAIVILHTFYCAIRLFSPQGNAELMSLMVRNCMLWAVPVFVMVTGALLLNPDKHVTTGKIFHGYIRRALCALIVFTFVFALFDFLVDRHAGGPGAFLIFWLQALLLNRSWLHMWYLYMLIGIYLMLPLFRLVTRSRDDRILRYTILILAVFQSVIPTVNFFLSDSSVGFYIMVNTVYPLYLFLGYAIHTGKIRVTVPAAFLMTVCGAAVILLSTVAGLKNGWDGFSQIAGNYASVPVVVASCGIFSLFHAGEPGGKAEPVRAAGSGEASGYGRTSAFQCFLMALDRCSFGIYLVHVLVIYTIYRVFLFQPYAHAALPALLLVAVISFAASFALSALLRHIPGFRKFL